MALARGRVRWLTSYGYKTLVAYVNSPASRCSHRSKRPAPIPEYFHSKQKGHPEEQHREGYDPI